MSFPRYPAYKPSGVEWLGEVPAHWEVQPLRRIECAVQTGPFGSQLHADEYVVDGTPVINPVNLVNGDIVPDPDVTVGPDVVQRLQHQMLCEGDIVFARRGELGRCALASSNHVGWICGTGSMIVRLISASMHSEYLSAHLSLDIIRQYFLSSSIGAVMDSLSTPTLLGMPLIQPPLAEQVAIAEFASRETTKIDALIAEQESLIALLAEKRQAMISHAVTKGLNPDAPMKDSGVEWMGSIPAHWSVVQSRRLFRVRSELARPDDEPVTASQVYGMILQSAFTALEGRRVAEVIQWKEKMRNRPEVAV